MAAEPQAFRYIGTKRRPKEDRRFVAGSGRFVADIGAARHAACGAGGEPAIPHARIVAHRRHGGAGAARRARGADRRGAGARHRAADERSRSAQDDALSAGAVGVARYVGEWVVAVVAETRALAEDAAELVEVEYEPLPHVDRSRGGARSPTRRSVHPDHGSQRALSPAHSSGVRSRRISPRAPHRDRLSRALAPQRDGADRDLRRGGAVGRGGAAARRLGLDPDAEISRPARARAAPAGQCRARPFRRRCRRQLWRQARPQAQRARRISRARAGRAGAARSRTGSRTCAAATRTGPTASSTSRWRSTATASCAP